MNVARLTVIMTAVRNPIDVSMCVKDQAEGGLKKEILSLGAEILWFSGGGQKMPKNAKKCQKSQFSPSANFWKMAQNPVSILGIFPEKTHFCYCPR